MNHSTDDQLHNVPARQPSMARYGLVLGLVAISGPLAITMYGPAFEEIARDLRTSIPTVQLSLVSFFIALAFGQNIYGPLSDRYGRKLPLYIGLGLFLAASIAASLASSIEELIAWRFLQGLGACAAIAMPRAIVRDLHTGPQAARLLGIVLLLSSIAPLLAPLLGSGLTLLFSWRAIFWSLAAAGGLGLVLVHFMLPETRPAHRRTAAPMAVILSNYAALLKDREFMGLALAAGLGQATFFSFVGGSPFVFLTLFELESWQYSMIFGVAAGIWGVSAQFTSALMRRVGGERVVKVTALIGTIITVLLFGAAAFGVGGLWAFSILLVLIFATSGLMMPSAIVLALHAHEANAGTASALLGTMGFATGAVASTLVSTLADGTALPMVGLMALCTAGSLVAAWVALDWHQTERDASSAQIR